MILFDGIYTWEGWGGALRLGHGKCRLRLFDLTRSDKRQLAHLHPYIGVVTDVEGSPMSVRSCTSHVVSKVAQEFQLPPQRMIWVEYYPPTVYGPHSEHHIAERFDRVEFTWHGDRAIQPRWRPVTPPLLEILKKLIGE